MQSSKANEAAAGSDEIPVLGKTPLREDLLRMYNGHTFCDVTLHVQQKTFQAHKIILSARSPVFQAMFEIDAKEKRTGIVEITDLDPDTVEKMLSFMYSDVVDLQTDSAISLYSAADKYQIGLLKSECSTFLKSQLDLNNVLQVLTLADLHRDEDLKQSAVDYISNNATAVFKSEAWKAFVTGNGALAADVMHDLFAVQKMTCSVFQLQDLNYSMDFKEKFEDATYQRKHGYREPMANELKLTRRRE